MKLSALQVDPILSTQGVDCDFGQPDENGRQATLKIAYSGNEVHRSKLARLTRNAAQQIPGREIPTDAFVKLNKEAMVGTVLLGWTNFEDDDDEPIEPLDENGNLIEDNCRRMLNILPIFEFVSNESAKLERFQRDKENAADAALKSGASLEAEVVRTT